MRELHAEKQRKLMCRLLESERERFILTLNLLKTKCKKNHLNKAKILPNCRNTAMKRSTSHPTTASNPSQNIDKVDYYANLNRTNKNRLDNCDYFSGRRCTSSVSSSSSGSSSNSGIGNSYAGSPNNNDVCGDNNHNNNNNTGDGAQAMDSSLINYTDDVSRIPPSVVRILNSTRNPTKPILCNICSLQQILMIFHRFQ